MSSCAAASWAYCAKAAGSGSQQEAGFDVVIRGGISAAAVVASLRLAQHQLASAGACIPMLLLPYMAAASKHGTGAGPAGGQQEPAPCAIAAATGRHHSAGATQYMVAHETPAGAQLAGQFFYAWCRCQGCASKDTWLWYAAGYSAQSDHRPLSVKVCDIGSKAESV